MFRITVDSCRTFLLAEILIMAAMNADSHRFAEPDRQPPEDLPRSPLPKVRATLVEGLYLPQIHSRRDEHER